MNPRQGSQEIEDSFCLCLFPPAQNSTPFIRSVSLERGSGHLLLQGREGSWCGGQRGCGMVDGGEGSSPGSCLRIMRHKSPCLMGLRKMVLPYLVPMG